jgi:DNA-binding NarL/FixJ family response regulator
VTGPDAATPQRWRRLRPVRLALDIADRALRADTADACEDLGFAVADAPAEADVVLIDRPVATALPAIALVPDGTERPGLSFGSSFRSWPAAVCAAVPAGMDAETLAAVITVVAAGYALTTRRDAGQGAGTNDAGGDDISEEAGGDDAEDVGGDADAPGRALSAREREVLALLAGGASNKEIALALALSVSTVKFHVAAIIDKLGARSRVDAVALAVRAGLVMV